MQPRLQEDLQSCYRVALKCYSLLGFTVSRSRVKHTTLLSASKICQITSSDIPSKTYPLIQGWEGVSEEIAHMKWEEDLLSTQTNTGEEGNSRSEKYTAPASAQPFT